MNILCNICSDLVNQDNILVTKCGHIFHHHCLAQWIERSRSCPQCRAIVTEALMFKVYPTISNEYNVEDAVTLQSKLDDAELQLRQNSALLKEKEDKLSALKGEISVLKGLIKSIEGKLASREITVGVMRNELIYANAQLKNAEKFKDENENLKAILRTQNGLQKVLNETATEVENMMKENVDTKSLAVYVVALKKALMETEQKKKEVRDKLDSVRQQLALQKKLNATQKIKIAEQEEIISNAERRYKTLKYKRKVSGGEENKEAVVVKQPRLEDSHTASDTTATNTTVLAMAERIQNADSPYLSLKQNSLAMSLDTTCDLIPDHWALKPSEVAMIKSSRSIPVKIQNDNPSTSIFHKKTQLKPETQNQTGISYDGLGGHSKLDIFPKPKARPIKSLVPKLTAKHRLQRPKKPGSQDISKLFNKSPK